MEHIREVYNQYIHLDQLLSDIDWLEKGNIQQRILYDLWVAIRKTIATEES